MARQNWFNPSALYGRGVEAHKLLEQARKDAARVLCGKSAHSVHADEIIFTGGGTESNNLAIQGVLKCWTKTHGQFDYLPHVIISAIEHPAVKKLVQHLVTENKITASVIDVTEDGLIDLAQLKEVLRLEEHVVLVSVMMVNNELGTIQPISEVAGLIRKYRKEHGLQYPVFHTDACQAANYLDMQVDKLGVDLLTLDGGKIYGPRGVGCLYKKRNVQLDKIFYGGAQEMDIRPGTENLPGIVGFAAALSMVHTDKEKENKRLRTLQEYVVRNIPEHIFINGSMDSDKRISNNINICIPGMDSEFALFKFDVAGIELSTGTTCQNKQEDSRSYVVDALGKGCGASSLRISMGRYTRMKDMRRFIAVLKRVLAK